MKANLLIIAALLLTLTGLRAQVCTPDTMALDSGSFIAPRPYIEGDSTSGIQKTACVGEYYELAFTMYIPDVVVTMGIPIGLSYAQINPTSAAKGLPAGLSYKCNPEDCRMIALQYGCVVLSGTISDTVTPGNYDLTIDLTLGTVLAPLEARLPGPILPGVYTIVVKEAGQCDEISSVRDYSEASTRVNILSNPLTPNSSISIYSDQEWQTQISIHDLMGRTLSVRNVQLHEGINRFPVVTEPLNPGTYFISVGQGRGTVTKKVMVLP